MSRHGVPAPSGFLRSALTISEPASVIPNDIRFSVLRAMRIDGAPSMRAHEEFWVRRAA